METVPVSCNHCGASLQVPEWARFVTCRYCNSQLEIKRTESTITTEVLARIDQNTAAMAEDLHALRQESELERLDREWGQRQAALFMRDKYGNTSRPNAASGIVVAVIMGGFGVVWTIIASVISGTISAGAHAAGAPAPFSMLPCVFPLFGLFFIAMAVGICIKTAGKARQYEREEALYQAKRAELLSRDRSDSAR